MKKERTKIKIEYQKKKIKDVTEVRTNLNLKKIT
jgi:hypothetical protein